MLFQRKLARCVIIYSKLMRRLALTLAGARYYCLISQTLSSRRSVCYCLYWWLDYNLGRRFSQYPPVGSSVSILKRWSPYLLLLSLFWEFVFDPCIVLYCCAVLSSFAIISLRKRELVDLLCLLAFMWLLLYCVSSSRAVDCSAVCDCGISCSLTYCLTSPTSNDTYVYNWGQQSFRTTIILSMNLKMNVFLLQVVRTGIHSHTPVSNQCLHCLLIYNSGDARHKWVITTVV